MPEKLRQLYGQKFYAVTRENGETCLLGYKSLQTAKDKLNERECVIVELEIVRVSTINPFLTEIERNETTADTSEAPEQA